MQQPPQKEPQKTPPQEEPKVAAVIKLSSTTSSWATACRDWQKGKCARGIACNFCHKGFPVSERKCITCGDPAHGSKECTAPGGGADPNRLKVWADYKKRRDCLLYTSPSPRDS